MWLSAASRARNASRPRACTTADIRRFCLITLVELPELDLTEADRWWHGDNPYLAPTTPDS